MFQPIRTLSLVLVAAALLPGCARATGPVVTPPVVRPASKAGTVKVSFPGLKPATPLFKTLATRADIASVALTLVDARNKKQVRKLDRTLLWLPQVEASFTQVAAGPVRFEVVAYDEHGDEIGHAETSDRVLPNQTTMMKLSVKLAPQTGTGHVAALIDFIDGDAGSPCGTEAFHQADHDGDGMLDLSEYVGGYPFAMCDVPVGRPTPMPAFVPGASSASDGYKLSCMPLPVDPVREFEARDVDRDGRLSLDEFLGLAPPPVDPCEDSFKALDVDADGRLTFQEWSADRPVAMSGPAETSLPYFPDPWLQRKFTALDVNGDAVLDLDEHCGRVAPPLVSIGVTRPVADPVVALPVAPAAR